MPSKQELDGEQARVSQRGAAWITELAFVIFERVATTGSRRLAFYTTRRLDADEITGLMVDAELSIRNPDSPPTVRFVTKSWRTERRSEKSYQITLEPLEGESEIAVRDIREVKTGVFLKPTNVRTLKLSQGGQSRLFYDSGGGYFFCDCSLPRSRQGGTGCA
jgi:hypothetical protein